jgi:isopenicillin N synthase-like dioxygenase
MAKDNEIPVIDASILLSNIKDPTTLAQLQNACSNYGFFYLLNNETIPTELIERFRTQSRIFFQQPKSDLYGMKRTESNSRGYFDDELTKTKLDWKECFDYGCQDGNLDNEGLDGKNQWPLKSLSKLDYFESTMREYFIEIEKLSVKILESIAESLGWKKNTFEKFFGSKHTSFQRINYYRVCPDPEIEFGVHHHTDAGVLTVLLQDDSLAALQVLERGLQEENWINIQPRKDTFVVNIGDMMQVWTNDVYKAAVHRVKVNNSTERFSMPFFYNPSYETNVKPLGLGSTEDTNLDLVNEFKNLGLNAAKYRPINWGEFRHKRFAGDYADQGEEVQITHYKI